MTSIWYTTGRRLGKLYTPDSLVVATATAVVPTSVSVTFAFLAFRAVRKQKAPDRCNRVVWGAALASATVNFAYEYTHSGHNLVAGGYLALLSLFGMVMFHEFLDQFEEARRLRLRLMHVDLHPDMLGHLSG